MANEKRLIDANALKERIYEEPTDGMYTHEIIAAIDEQPTVDAVEVVRCKDCEHYEAERVGIPGGDPRRVYECGYCYYWRYEEGDSPNSVDADDFCSYGERRTE